MSKHSIRAQICKAIKQHLNADISNYIVFSEEHDKDYYAVSMLRLDRQHCILASCDNVSNPNGAIVLMGF